MGSKEPPGSVDGAALAAAALALARRFAAGGTLWCVAPEWPEHGRHVAVEFVHPVVVGKRALPAVSVAGPDAVDALRTTAGPDDAVVVVAAATSAAATDVLRRAPAWGLLSVWVGAGPRPTDPLGDHLVWVDADPATARHDGQLVLRYHLLWELSQVCFEHPGLLRVGDPCDDPEGGARACITCSDEGLPAEVTAVLEDGLVSVRTPRGLETIDVALVGEVTTGDLLLVHAGTAIERLEGQGA